MPVLETFSANDQLYRRILRHIRKHRLGKGDRLPTQSQWLRELRCGTLPFNQAMRLLEKQGVVCRRNKAGTHLLRAAPPSGETVPWTIALCIVPASEMYGGVGAVILSQYIHTRLQAAGCQLRIYSNDGQYRLHHELSEFGSLVQDVERERVDGAVFMRRLMTCEHERLSRHGVIECGVHMAGALKSLDASGVVIDQGPMIRQAVELLARGGSRRIALIMPGAPWVPEKSYFESVFRQAMAKHPQATGVEMKIWGSVWGGTNLGKRLLRMSPEHRPDALIFTRDDHVALGFTHTIHPVPTYRPAIATLTNRQVPLPFPLPVYRFERDLVEIAEKSVRFLLDRLHDPVRAIAAQRVAPRLNEDDASELPRFMRDWGRTLPRQPVPRAEMGQAERDGAAMSIRMAQRSLS